MSHELAIIPNDGYTQGGYVAEVKRLHPAVRFTYRPLTYANRSAIGAAVAGKAPESATKTLAAILAKQLVTWDVKDDKDADLNCNDSGAILKLRPALFDKLYLTISGDRPSDLDPLGDHKAQANEEELNVDAILGGKSLANLREETALKN